MSPFDSTRIGVSVLLREIAAGLTAQCRFVLGAPPKVADVCFPKTIGTSEISDVFRRRNLSVAVPLSRLQPSELLMKRLMLSIY